MKGVFLDKETIDRGDLNFEALFNLPITWRIYNETTPDQVIERIHPAAIVITNKVNLNRATLEQAPNLSFINIIATGTNNVDLVSAKNNGITVSNIRNYATASVTQHVFMLILALLTNLNRYQNAIKQGLWNKHFCMLDYPVSELNGKKLGIIGYGVLGQSVACVAKAFGMEVLISQRPKTHTSTTDKNRIPFHDLLPMVDILSLHCPLTEDTYHLIGTEELKMMKTEAILINTARGDIVDGDALRTALLDNTIAGAGIDVLSEEPPSMNHPLLSINLPQLIITPHIAWASQTSRQQAIAETVKNIQAFLNHQPRNRV